MYFLASDDVKLASTEDIILAWFGTGTPESQHPLATEAGAFIQCKKADKVAFVKMLISTMTSKSSAVVDIYNPNCK